MNSWWDISVWTKVVNHKLVDGVVPRAASMAKKQKENAYCKFLQSKSLSCMLLHVKATFLYPKVCNLQWYKTEKSSKFSHYKTLQPQFMYFSLKQFTDYQNVDCLHIDQPANQALLHFIELWELMFNFVYPKWINLLSSKSTPNATHC